MILPSKVSQSAIIGIDRVYLMNFSYCDNLPVEPDLGPSFTGSWSVKYIITVKTVARFTCPDPQAEARGE